MMRFGGIKFDGRNVVINTPLPKDNQDLFISIHGSPLQRNVHRSNKTFLKRAQTIARQIFGENGCQRIHIKPSPEIPIVRKSFNFFGFPIKRIQNVPILFFTIVGSKSQKREFLIKLGINSQTLREEEKAQVINLMRRFEIYLDSIEN